jgi:hypothetical protein
MRTIESVTDISASPQKVWEVLTSFSSYSSWTSYIQKIDGHAETGTRLTVILGPPDRRPYVVRTPVLDATPGVRLAWAAMIPGAAWLPRTIFTGVHEFTLTSLPGGKTRLTQREHFSGLLARLSREGARGADEGFEAFNIALKRRAEDSVGERRAPETTP